MQKFTDDPVQIEPMPGISALRRVKTFFGHLDARVYVSDKAYLDIGRGSLEAARLTAHNTQEFEGCIGSIGQFCNFSGTARLFAGGEHRNDQPVNIVFGNIPLFNSIAVQSNAQDLRPAVHRKFLVGNAVVLSADSRVLGGATVGDGSLLAAGAVVTNVAPPFSIVAGLPARKIRDRVDEQTQEKLRTVRWWDFETTYLMNNLSNIQNVSVDTNTRHCYRTPTPRLVFRVKPESAMDEIDILGFEQDGALKPLADAPQRVQQYIAQAAGSGPYYWLANIW